IAESLAPPLPAFTPVPVRARRDGWTPARQLRFMDWLLVTRAPARAARAVGPATEVASSLRHLTHGASFHITWGAADATGQAPRVRPSRIDAWHLGGTRP